MAKKANGGVPRGRQSKNRHQAKRKQSKQQVEKALAGPLKKKPTQPRPRPLPGMENARIRPLDDICQSIAEGREQMNALRHEDVDHQTVAMRLMRKHKKTSWRHAGVELERIPGEEKLRVRTARERTATAEVEEEQQEAADVVEESHTEPEDAPDLEDTVIGDDGIEAAPV